MSESCVPHHDWFTATLAGGLCIGLVISYLPQHLRIIMSKSSEGFSPWFLLLGSTSSAAGMLNMLTMQWGVVKCCPVLSIGNCIEMSAGIIQVGLMWFLFTVMYCLVLYIIYYPPHLKYVSTPVSTPSTESQVELDDNTGPPSMQTKYRKTYHWRLSIILAWVVVVHLILTTLITLILLLTSTPQPAPPSLSLQMILADTARVTFFPLQIHTWATFLGVSSAVLATTQYAPQLYHTYCSRLVGALSIKMMLIQTPGTVFMVLSIALRPGTNWSSWIMFGVTGVMQGSLLVMCIAWKYRQRRLGIDDFGRPLSLDPSDSRLVIDDTYSTYGTASDMVGAEREVDVDVGESTPLLASDRPNRFSRMNQAAFRRIRKLLRLSNVRG